MRYDRACALRTKPAADITALTAQAETTDAEGSDPQALPEELARRDALRTKLDAACKRLEAQARAQAEAARPAYESKKAAYDAKKGRRGRPPMPPGDAPRPERQTNLTDPDSALMRRSDAHEYRQAYNAQAVVCADGAQLILATNLVATPADAPSFAMKAKLETEEGKAHYKKRKQTVEPVFGIIKSAIGFTRFRLRSLTKAATEWTLIALAYNCRRIVRLQTT